jgi:polysaccharide export outer membrane protein
VLAHSSFGLSFLRNFPYLRGLHKRENMRIRLIFYTLSILLLASCASPEDFYYLRNAGNEKIAGNSADTLTSNPMIQPGDQLSIIVTSSSPELTMLLNSNNLGGMQQLNQSNVSVTSGYYVANNETIEFPKVGVIVTAGLTFKNLEHIIEKGLSDYVKDVAVTVRRMNFRITMLGEIARPGMYNVQYDRINILQAIGNAGDLTIFGKRDNILLVRESPQGKETVRLSLYDKELLNSPYYYLKSGDVIYVEPNRTRVNTNTTFFQVWPTIISSLSVLLVIVNQIAK